MAEKGGSTKRSKIEDFFSGKKQGDIEDPLDIYSHTGKFFKQDKKTDSYADTIEVGQRKIRAGIDESELDQAVYGGKKVSRKELE